MMHDLKMKLNILCTLAIMTPMSTKSMVTVRVVHLCGMPRQEIYLHSLWARNNSLLSSMGQKTVHCSYGAIITPSLGSLLG